MKYKIFIVLYTVFIIILLLCCIYYNETKIKTIPVVISENGVYKIKGVCEYNVDYNLSWYLDKTLYIDIKNITVNY